MTRPARAHAVARSRPAEATSAAAGTGALIAALLAHNWLAAGIAAVGFVPAVVTLLVTYGGLRGVLQALWSGRPSGNGGYTLLELVIIVLMIVILVFVLVRVAR